MIQFSVTFFFWYFMHFVQFSSESSNYCKSDQEPCSVKVTAKYTTMVKMGYMVDPSLGEYLHVVNTTYLLVSH